MLDRKDVRYSTSQGSFLLQHISHIRFPVVHQWLWTGGDLWAWTGESLTQCWGTSQHCHKRQTSFPAMLYEKMAYRSHNTSVTLMFCLRFSWGRILSSCILYFSCFYPMFLSFVLPSHAIALLKLGGMFTAPIVLYKLAGTWTRLLTKQWRQSSRTLNWEGEGSMNACGLCSSTAVSPPLLTVPVLFKQKLAQEAVTYLPSVVQPQQKLQQSFPFSSCFVLPGIQFCSKSNTTSTFKSPASRSHTYYVGGFQVPGPQVPCPSLAGSSLSTLEWYLPFICP